MNPIRAKLEPLYAAMERVLVGRRPLVDRLLITLATDGHVLLESVPGLAKTLAVKALSQALQLSFQRVQFTPDLLPADVLGTQIYNPKSGEFTIRRGPIFANIVLADEINRAPAKVQSALLEAMQERRVTLGETTFPLPRPFFVLATQNPLEQEGTYPLPEAQLDRFLLKIVLDYPSKADELAILERMGSVDADVDLQPVLSAEDLAEVRGAVDRMYLDEKLKNYLVDLVRCTRTPKDYGLAALTPLIQYGASPRATLSLARAAKASAFLNGRDYVNPDDIRQLAPDVLRHRLILTYEAEAEDLTADSLIRRILDAIPIP